MNFFVAKYNNIPDAIEFKHGANQYIQGKWVLINSLNESFDTLYFYGLNGHAIAQENEPFNPRFVGPIIMYSVYSAFTGDSNNYTPIISVILLTLSLAISLIIAPLDWKHQNQIYIIIAACTGLYLIYWWLLFDTAIAYLQVFLGHYFLTEKQKPLLGHFLFISACWFRYEYILFYGIHFLFFGINKRFLWYIIGGIISISLILSVQAFYKSEIWISKDRLSYLNILYQESRFETTENIQDNWEENNILDQAKNDADISPINTALRTLRLTTDSLKTRWIQMKYLLIKLWFISPLIMIWWVFFIKNVAKVTNKETKNVILFSLSLITFIFLIYSGSTSYWFDREVFHGSFIRYSLGLILFMSALWGIYIARQAKLILVLVTTFGILWYVSFLHYTVSIYSVQDKYRIAAHDYIASQNILMQDTIWLNKWSLGDEIKSLFLENQNQFNYDLISDDLLELAILKLLQTAQEKQYTVIYGKIWEPDEKIQPLIMKYFEQPEQRENMIFYKNKRL